MELGKGSKGSRNRNLLSTKSFFELLPSLLALDIHLPHSKGISRGEQPLEFLWREIVQILFQIMENRSAGMWEITQPPAGPEVSGIHVLFPTFLMDLCVHCLPSISSRGYSNASVRAIKSFFPSASFTSPLIQYKLVLENKFSFSLQKSFSYLKVIIVSCFSHFPSKLITTNNLNTSSW